MNGGGAYQGRRLRDRMNVVLMDMSEWQNHKTL
jgi:hypothetical protein